MQDCVAESLSDTHKSVCSFGVATDVTAVRESVGFGFGLAKKIKQPCFF